VKGDPNSPGWIKGKGSVAEVHEMAIKRSVVLHIDDYLLLAY
jgi:hypothetical protein